MKHFSSAVCVAALLLGASAAVDIHFSSAIAQDVQIGFSTFHRQLAPYGDWVYSDRWGEVWLPNNVSDDFHPYGTAGRWVYTGDYGWTWSSDYEWSDIPFHYGRWVNDPDNGWMWIPGYVWSPGWVVWRHNGQYTGWMPAPPDDEFLGRQRPSFGISIGGFRFSFNEGNDYGYSRWYGPGYGEDRYAQNWVFIGTGHMGERDYRRFYAPRNNYRMIIRNTTNVTNYTVVNNYVVNRSIDVRTVQKAGGHVQTVRLTDVIKRPQFVIRADMGSQIQQRARADRPRGSGFANSAPKPTADVVQSLSQNTPPLRDGRARKNLFTRDTVANAPLPPAPANTGGSVTQPDHKGGPKPGPNMTVPTTPPSQPDHNQTHDHGAGPAMSGPAMTGPANPGTGSMKTPDKTVTPGTSGPAMTGPAMSGPANAPEQLKHGRRAHNNTGTPDASGPAATGPAPTGPAMSGPAMTGPVETGSEPKRGRHPSDNATAPGMSGPATTGPAMTGPGNTPPVPKHEHATQAPVTQQPAATPPADPNEDKERRKKHQKPDDANAPQ